MALTLAQKTCTQCGNAKSLECFYKHPHGAGGRMAKCAECFIELMRVRHFKKIGKPLPPKRVQMTPEEARNRVNERARKKYALIRDAEMKRRRDGYYANLEKSRAGRRERQKRYRERHPERVTQIYEAWKLSHPNYEPPAKSRDTIRAGRHNRRARLRNAEGKITKKLVALIRAEQSDKCVYCPAALDGGGHLDHMTPLSRGGTNLRENLQWLCEPCNLKKHKRTHEEYVVILEMREAA